MQTGMGRQADSDGPLGEGGQAYRWRCLSQTPGGLFSPMCQPAGSSSGHPSLRLGRRAAFRDPGLGPRDLVCYSPAARPSHAQNQSCSESDLGRAGVEVPRSPVRQGGGRGVAQPLRYGVTCGLAGGRWPIVRRPQPRLSFAITSSGLLDDDTRSRDGFGERCGRA
jgi:hypothetical protein